MNSKRLKLSPFVGSLLATAALSTCAVAQSGAEDLRLTVGKSIVVDYPSDVRQISTSDPAVVDASPVTTREILIHGKGLGSATLIVWSKAGDRTFYNITVESNLDPLRRLYRETFPNEEIHIQSSRDSVSITGKVSSQAVADRAVALASAFGKTIVNNLQLGAPPVEKQVVLKVKFAELDRSKASQFGVNILGGKNPNPSFGLGGINQVQFNNSATGGFSNSTQGSSGANQSSGTGSNSTFTVSDVLNIFTFIPDLDLAAFVKALQAESILQILAEPNIVATNGKEASFLVGGEVPVPVPQPSAGSTVVTVQFKEFGIRLRFTPQVTANGTVKLHLFQEVSAPDLANAVSLGGLSIPAFTQRRAETDVEIGQGQSFLVAGLLDNREQESISKVPGLSALPILGALFKNKDVRKSRTELVMIVTPELAVPMTPGQTVPTPVFPREFLAPIDPTKIKASAAKPDATKAEANSQKEATSASAAQSAQKRHWFDIRRIVN